MATIQRYVNTASTAGGDGTTNATSGANRAYASLSEWEAAERADLVTAGDIHIVTCEGSTADTTAVQILSANWTTGPSNYIEIRCDIGAGRHDGKWNTSAYRMEVTVDGSLVVTTQAVRVIGLQFLLTTTTSQKRSFRAHTLNTGADIRVSDCIFRATVSGVAGHEAFSLEDSDGTYRVFNNIIYGYNTTGSIGINTEGSSGTYYCYNNTIDDCDIGMTGQTGFVAKNNVVFNSTTAYSGSFHANSTNNGYDNGSAPGSSGIDLSAEVGTDLFTNYGSNNYLPKAGSALLAAGADLSADSNIAITVDAIGTTRPATPDIGALEYATAVANKRRYSLSLTGVG